jgi:hypothetical protein
MAKNDNKPKSKLLTQEDMKIIQSDPVGLADYVVHTKVKEVRKSALIIALIAMALAFAGGVFCGMAITKTSIPNNVVQIQVGEDAKPIEEGK